LSEREEDISEPARKIERQEIAVRGRWKVPQLAIAIHSHYHVVVASLSTTEK